MKTCYCCHRNEEEVRIEFLALIQKELEQEEQFVKMEMEEENKQVFDLQEEWKTIKEKTTNNLSEIFSTDIFTIMKNTSSSENPEILKYFEKARTVLGNSLSSIKVSDIENELKDKIEKIRNLAEYNGKLEDFRKKYQSKVNFVRRENKLIIMRKIAINESKKPVDENYEVTIGICLLCQGIIKKING